MATKFALSRLCITGSINSTGGATRCFSDDRGRILSEEERAAENVYIQKMERERLEKLKRKAEKEKAEKEAPLARSPLPQRRPPEAGAPGGAWARRGRGASPRLSPQAGASPASNNTADNIDLK